MTSFFKKHKAVSLVILGAMSVFSFAQNVFAHEAYVLNKNFFWSQMKMPFNSEALNALKNPHNFHVTVIIVTSVIVLLLLNYFFRRSKFGSFLNEQIEKLSFLGPIFIRVAIAASFFYSALTNSFLGPELQLGNMPMGHFIKIILFAASGMIALGLFTELAALASFIAFTIGFFAFGTYLLTYFNYLGEIIVLLLFGMRKWSVDGLIFGKLKRFATFKKYDTSIVRIFYGIALSWAAITVKFLHPALTVTVVNTYHLTRFWWLFPGDPLLVTLGAGLAELAIGIFIILGFEMRLTVFISLIYITMSLIYFRELVWPHLMLYGISLNLIVQPEMFTLDHMMFEKKKWKLLKRPFFAHTKG